MDPWLMCQTDLTISGTIITKFEDNFVPPFTKLPDSEEYLANLEAKLRKLQLNPNILSQLAAKKEACMQQLLKTSTELDDEILTLEEPIENLQILRTVTPQQALTQGELVELIKYDQLKYEDCGDKLDESSFASR
ncbi:unnamed protein product [Acanthoscelides obtectus]|uniref:Uncharacterized protein n=1 Tax=Acanthoscelides obtectus TaxID=200917 RepID=A0A9P0MJ56_ACAOB|nr:unnamed protein product [Acanthoscelides obtectus]CAK1634136.1 hypothetical protein AOBTE_LOCUS8627 [Acanthoscelides obtectus]